MERATTELIGIKAMSRDEIAEALTEGLGQKPFRVKQVLQWLYKKGASSYDEMTDLPAALRAQLAERYPLRFPEVARKQVSTDGTRKYLLRLGDGNTVETVGIPSKDRLAVCVSTQVGCPMRCDFCATGRGGYARNLGAGEIADQVSVVAKDFGQRVSSVVMMGQGEPFLNYDAVVEAARILNSKDGPEIGARHITVSTAGVLPQIRRFAAEPEQFTLAVSLHSAVQETRDMLMPGVRKYPLERLRDAVASYAESTGRRPTYEYALIEGVNDTDAELRELVAFCRRTLCHVNLIGLNKVPGSRYAPAPAERIALFEQRLKEAGVETSVRNPRGADIDAACGQLKQRG